jgi:hypothetical protein
MTEPKSNILSQPSDPIHHSPAHLFSPLDIQLAFTLSGLLILAYLLTFSGEFSSIDELATYAATESLAQIQQFVTPQVTFAASHNPVGLIEPGLSLMGLPLYWLASQLAHVNNIHAVLLMNVFVTALTGAALFLLLRLMQYGALSATLATLAYGLATLAWPYARTFFREPLVGLMWIVATAGFVAWRKSGQHRYALGCLLTTLLSLAFKISAAIAVPVFLLALAIGWPMRRRSQAWWLLGGIGAVTLVAVTGGFLWRYGQLPALANYTFRYPVAAALIRTFGQFLSPAKGLLFYSPILLFTSYGWVEVWKRQRAVACIVLGLTLGVLYVYGNNATWYGGLVWGPRFMLPLVPLFAISIAGGLTSRNWIARGGVMLSAMLSLTAQVGVVIAEWGDANGQMDLAATPDVPWYDLRLWQQSPAIYQLTHWKPQWLNLLWWHRMSDNTVLRDLPLAMSLALLLALASVILAWSLKARDANKRTGATLVTVTLLVALGCGIVLNRGYADTRDYPGLSIQEGRDLATQVSALNGPPFTLVSVSNEFHIYYWLGLIKGHFIHHWYSPATKTGFEPVLRPALPAQVVWLYVDRVHLQKDHSGIDAEFWLNRNAYQVDTAWFGGHKVMKYIPQAGPLPTRAVNRVWTNGIELVSIGRQADQISPGQALRLDFEFKRIGPIAEDDYVFVQLVRADGQVIPGRDGEPQFGGAPTTQWQQDERVLDRRAILIPPNASSGAYTIYFGFLSPTTGRIPTCDDGYGSDDHAELGTVEILPPGK